jgi:hypothetical protein
MRWRMGRPRMWRGIPRRMKRAASVSITSVDVGDGNLYHVTKPSARIDR